MHPHLIHDSLGPPHYHPKQQLDQFSHFCTVNGVFSLYLTSCRPIPLICPLLQGSVPGYPYPIYSSLSPPDSPSCKNFVNFCPVTPEMTELICIPMYLYRAKIDLYTVIRRAAIQKCHSVSVSYTHLTLPTIYSV